MPNCNQTCLGRLLAVRWSRGPWRGYQALVGGGVIPSSDPARQELGASPLRPHPCSQDNISSGLRHFDHSSGQKSAPDFPDVDLSESAQQLEAKAFPLYGNIYVLTLRGERPDTGAEAEVLRHPTRDNVDQFDLPERDRMYALATQFVASHVRRVRTEGALKSRDRSFGSGTLVVLPSQSRASRFA